MAVMLTMSATPALSVGQIWFFDSERNYRGITVRPLFLTLKNTKIPAERENLKSIFHVHKYLHHDHSDKGTHLRFDWYDNYNQYVTFTDEYLPVDGPKTAQFLFSGHDERQNTSKSDKMDLYRKETYDLNHGCWD